MATETRRATLDDIPHLARFQIEAYGGCFEVLYDGLMQGQSLESLVQSQLTRPDTTPYYENHWIAMHEAQVAGGILAFPMDDLAELPRDPRVPEERHEMAEGFLPHLPAPGTYYIHTLTVYPEFHRKGIATTLLSLGLGHAREKGFAKCSLYVFAENVGAIALYKKYGFKETDRGPVTEHPLFYNTGDMVLMTCVV